MEKIRNYFEHLTLESLLPSLVILVCGVIAIGLILRLYDYAGKRSKMERAARGFLRSLLRVLLWILLLMALLMSLGVSMGSLLAVLSVISLAISLAVQSELANVVSGVSLLLNKPFKAGDFVQIAGKSGTVTEIRIFYTHIVTLDNQCICIPNSNVTSTEIVNYSALGERRIEIRISVSYDTPPALVRKTLLSLANQPETLFTPEPVAFIESYGDSAIEYILWVWTNSEDYLPTRIRINDQIFETFQRAGIELTYPHINVHLKHDPERKERIYDKDLCESRPVPVRDAPDRAEADKTPHSSDGGEPVPEYSEADGAVAGGI